MKKEKPIKEKDTVEIIDHIPYYLKNQIPPILATVIQITDKYILVRPKKLSYQVEFLLTDIKPYKK